MKHRLRVLLLIPHLDGGGAEQVTLLLAKNLSGQKLDLHLALVTQSDAGKHGLPPTLTVHTLRARRVRSATFKLVQLVRRLRPDVILSGIAHLNFLVLMLRPFFPSGTRVIVRQNATVSSVLASGDAAQWTGLCYRLLYPRADRVICQSAAMAEDLAKHVRIPSSRLPVLPNPIDIVAIRSISAEPCRWPGPGPHLLAVGRLSREKGFDLLLDAMARLIVQFPSADMTIAGEGPEEDALRTQCHSLGLDAAIHFAGWVEAPAAYFAGASVFVLPSRHEGLPNALLEAAAGGLPLVALPASEGLMQLASDRPGVWLARQTSAEALVESLSTALRTLAPDQRFPHPWVEEFGLASAIRAYESLIEASCRQVNA